MRRWLTYLLTAGLAFGACTDGGARAPASTFPSDADARGPDAPEVDARGPDAPEVDGCPAPAPVTIGHGEPLVVPGLAIDPASLPADWTLGADGVPVAPDTDPFVERRVSLAVTRACDAGVAPASLEVTLRAMSWQAAPSWVEGVSGPSAREHALFWIDPTTPDVMLLHGGLAYAPRQGTVVTDSWLLDLTTLGWQPLTPSGTPPATPGLWPTGRAAPAPDGAPGFWYMGGQDAGALPVSGLSAYDPRTPAFRAVTGVESSPARTLHGLVWDASHRRYLAFLGLGAGPLGYTFDTSVWALSPPAPNAAPETAPAAWTMLATEGKVPRGRYGFAYAFDTEGDRVIVVSGAETPTDSDPIHASRDVWALELGTSDGGPLTPGRWQELGPTGDDGPEGRNPCWAFDALGRRLWWFGGTDDGRTAVPGLWALHVARGAERWVRVPLGADAPPPRASCTMAYDRARHRLVLGFGNSEAGVFPDLWVLAL